MAIYLQLHPEMAHELMAPVGSMQRFIRRYERFLGGEEMLSVQNGAAQKARWDQEIFKAMLPGKPTVVANPYTKEEPTWRELTCFVCRNPLHIGREFHISTEFITQETGERVLVIDYCNDIKGAQLSPLLHSF